MRLPLKLFKLPNFLAFSLFILLISSNTISAQKFRIGCGISAITDVTHISPQKPPDLNLKDDDFYTTMGISLLSLSAEMKYNFHEVNSNMAISAASSPGIGLSNLQVGGAGGFGYLRIPLYIQFDFGCLSTRETKATVGFSAGIGYQLDSHGIFSKNKSLIFGSPAARIAVNYYTRYHTLMAIALKFGFPKTITTTNIYETQRDEYGARQEYELEVDTKITSIQLSWVYYFRS